MNTAHNMILSEAGTSFRPMAIPPCMPGFAVGPRTLDQAIQTAADQMEEELKPFPGDASQPFAQARAALALLVRCYAQQIYNSTSVASRAAKDPDFPWYWLESLPEARAIRRFRSENRDAIHYCLIAALVFQAEEKISAGKLAKASLPQLAEEAARRIIMAAYADSMELGAEQ